MMIRQSMINTGAVCATILAAAAIVGRAGPLTPPPGAVMPTPGPEPRTAISSLPFIIDQPGSYYLAGTLTGTIGQVGITIDADDVTLDLNGFALIGVPASLDGVRVNGAQRNIEIKNGSVRGWGQEGIDANAASNSVLENLRASDCGAVGLRIGSRSRVSKCVALDCAIGILTGSNCVVTKSGAHSNFGQGFLAGTGVTISNCAAEGNGFSGIDVNAGSTIRDCVARNNTQDGIKTGLAVTIFGCSASSNSDDGFDLGSKSRITDCNAYLNGDDGIALGPNSSAHQCTATTNGNDGIFATSECTVVDNHCADNGTGGTGAGVRTSGFGIRVESNNINSNQTGLQASTPNCYFADNTVQANMDNYDFVPGNQLNILLSEIPESIDWPASVTLAGSLTGLSGESGITITAPGVTIDMAGHSLIGVSGSIDGIRSTAQNFLAIHGGVVRDWGANGVNASGSSASLLHDLRATNNGAHGIVGSSFVVTKNCTSYENTGSGIIGGGGVVAQCTAGNNGIFGINTLSGVITQCRVRGNVETGIAVSQGLAHANAATAAVGKSAIIAGAKADNHEN